MLRRRLIFQCTTLIVQSEEEYQQLTEVEKEDAVVLKISQKKRRQLIKGIDRTQLCNKKRRQIHR